MVGPHPAGMLVVRPQLRARVAGIHPRNGITENIGIGIGERRIETIRESLGHDSEQRVGVRIDETVDIFGVPRPTGQAGIQDALR